MLDESIAELQPTKTEQQVAAEPAQPEKWSRDNHPAFKKAAAPEEKEEALVTYQVNDTVLAKWVSGDRAFYPARITSITGSSIAPIYIVKFKNYDSTETIRSKDIRPISNKRKADGPPTTAAPTPPAAPTLGLVSSAGATMYPEAKKDGQKDADAAPKPVKIRAKKVLEANKSKWQEFNSKSKIAKTKKKESMFRTPDGIGGRGKLRDTCLTPANHSNPFPSWLHRLRTSHAERPCPSPPPSSRREGGRLMIGLCLRDSVRPHTTSCERRWGEAGWILCLFLHHVVLLFHLASSIDRDRGYGGGYLALKR